jgi:hypothetical protein
MDEKAPVGGEEFVGNVARPEFDKAFDEQASKGFDKYGTYLKTFNGRNAYHDFLQELVDCLMYATQLNMELQQAKRDIKYLYDGIDFRECHYDDNMEVVAKRWGLEW